MGDIGLRACSPPFPTKVDIALVLRHLDKTGRRDYPRGFTVLKEWLSERQVRVFNYALSHGGSLPPETFHAKTILADAEHAYVGSANVTEYSLENSVELGVILSGRAALEISYVIDAVLQCATPWRFTL